jgi:hypothetical protein
MKRLAYPADRNILDPGRMRLVYTSVPSALAVGRLPARWAPITHLGCRRRCARACGSLNRRCSVVAPPR